MAAGAVDFNFRLPVKVEKEGDWYISSCPLLDVYSQGASEKEANANIVEALQLFIEECFENGTLEEVLKGSGFISSDDLVVVPDNRQIINISLPLVANG